MVDGIPPTHAFIGQKDIIKFNNGGFGFPAVQSVTSPRYSKGVSLRGGPDQILRF